jgi:folate-dependent phosphoribosylglycinamide formyltransferase PurN
MAGNPLRVVIFTSVPPRRVARILARIRRDASEAQVVGVLYERRPPKTLQQRVGIWRKKMKRLVYWRYVLHRVLAAGSKANGTELFITRDIHSADALDFVKRLNSDLGLIFSTRILKPVLFQIPKRGSINIHKRKVPDYRGGGAVGLWGLLDDQKAIGITIHRVEEKVDVGGVIRSALIPIEPFDDVESLAPKADVVGADLIVAAIRDFAHATVTETPQTGPSKLFRSPSAEDLLQTKTCGAAQRLRQLFSPAGMEGARQVSGLYPARSHSVTGGIGAAGIIP